MSTAVNYSLTSRHDFPGFVSPIFGETISNKLLVNPVQLENEAYTRLLFKLNADQVIVPAGWDDNETEIDRIDPDAKIRIYVSGLTVAMIAVLNAIKRLLPDNPVELMHFNRETGEYYPQIVR